LGRYVVKKSYPKTNTVFVKTMKNAVRFVTAKDEKAKNVLIYGLEEVADETTEYPTKCRPIKRPTCLTQPDLRNILIHN
jgi:hypothetical protein